MPEPKTSQVPAGGIFQYLVRMNGSPDDVARAQAALAASNPVTMGVYAALSLLPEGDLKSWLTANPIQFWKKIIQLFTGRTYQTGQYILGERYNDQIICSSDIGRRQVSDEMVPVARMIFTMLFGVRINNSEDLDSLDSGVAAYYARPNKGDIPQEAVERAVFLKQNFYPISTYNRQCWDLRYFEMYPLVAPIPEMNADPTREETNVGRFYTGELPGGAYAVDGVIPVDAQTIIRQLPPPDPDEVNEFNPVPVPIDDDQPGGGNFLTNAWNWVQQNPFESILLGGILAYVVYEFTNDD